MPRRIRFPLLCILLLLTPALLAGCPTTGGDDDDDLVLYGEVPTGAFVITEILAEPNTGRPEFIEVINTTAEPLNLQGCKVADAGAGEHEYSIGADVEVQGGARALLGRDPYMDPEETIQVAVVWSDIVLAQNDPLESVGLSCPDGTGARRVIDEVAFDWNGLGLAGGRSWQLNAEPDAVTNDDPANWCQAPEEEDAIYAVVDGKEDYGSPGGATICETWVGPNPSAHGEVVITEILIDEFTGLAEWFEIYNPGDSAFNLRGCQFKDIAQDSTSDPAAHTVDPEGGPVALQPGEFLLLVKGEVLAETIAADYTYSGLTFNNSDPQWLWLECPEEDVQDSWIEIDRIGYDWGTYGSDFEGRSLSLSSTLLTADANDDAASWCLAATEDSFFEVEGDEDELFIARGTPGEANPACVPQPDFPQEGDLVFTEVMARSAGAEIGHNEEWFEMHHVGNEEVSLVGCWFSNGNGVDLPAQDIIAAPLGLTVSPTEWPVFVKSSASDTIDCGLPYVHQYGTSISFNNESLEILALWCPGDVEDVLVDEISFNGGFEPGIPWQLRNGSEDHVDNDDPLNWCVDTDTSGYTWQCTVLTETNWGTPGEPSTCP